jgi:hypothetical protein
MLWECGIGLPLPRQILRRWQGEGKVSGVLSPGEFLPIPFRVGAKLLRS